MEEHVPTVDIVAFAGVSEVEGPGVPGVGGRGGVSSVLLLVMLLL